MGAKVSGCQGSLCFKEAKVRCSCSNIRLCDECFALHKREKPQLNHRATPLDQTSPTPVQPAGLTLSRLEFLREIYASPERTTTVHEGKVKGEEGRVAIKSMICRTEQDYKKKLQEATLQQGLKHPNICSCIAHFLDEDFHSGYRFIIVLEYSDRGDLEEDATARRLGNAPYPGKELIKHMTDLIDAFAYLQDRNLTHGDIKPKNVFMTNDGLLKIGDFGESRQGLQALVTQTTQIKGTIAYFSPLLFQAYVDTIKGRNTSGDVRHNPVKSDVYSLGLSFLHMALLSKPLELNNLDIGAEALQRDVDTTIIRLKYGKKVKQILSSMLQVQESRRYDFKQLRNLLTELFPRRNAVPEGLVEAGGSRELEEEKVESAPILPLIALSNNPSKAFKWTAGSKQTYPLISQKFQPSCRCCFLSSSILLITGGAKKPTGVFEMVAETLAVTAKADMNEGRMWHSICLLQGLVYVIAGRTPAKTAISSVEVLGETGWTGQAPLNTPRDSATAVVHDGAILVAGGSTNRAGRWELLNSIEKLEEGQWKVLAVELPLKLGGVGLASIGPSNLLVCGGHMNKGALSAKAWNLDTTSGDFFTLKDMPEEDSFASMTTAIFDNHCYLLGTLTGLFDYDPSTNEWDSARYLVKT